MRNKIFLLFFILIATVSYGQKQLTWVDLANINYTEKYFPAYKETFLYPSFSDEMKNLEGNQISIKGYYLDVDPQQKIYILSKGPMSACFFCGTGGPETAIELQFKNTPNFETDAIIRVTGTLKLNADDVEHFNYILTDCTATSIK